MPAVALFVAGFFPASIGGHSLWLTAFGETVHCCVDSVERHKSTRGSGSFSAHLRCGDRELALSPTQSGKVEQVGTELDVVADRTGLFSRAEVGAHAVTREAAVPRARDRVPSPPRTYDHSASR
ncbi:hypothetical protein [Lentzea sp. NPDC055074]